MFQILINVQYSNLSEMKVCVLFKCTGPQSQEKKGSVEFEFSNLSGDPALMICEP